MSLATGYFPFDGLTGFELTHFSLLLLGGA
jgi:hypothetical protein